MKYDLIVVGGGPGGLMAAKTAAEDGLKVLLIERKRDIPRINRACTSLFYLKWVCPDGYLEPVSVEACPDGTRFHFLKLGFSVDYSGPLVPYCNAIWISPVDIRCTLLRMSSFPTTMTRKISWLISWHQQ